MFQVPSCMTQKDECATLRTMCKRASQFHSWPKIGVSTRLITRMRILTKKVGQERSSILSLSSHLPSLFFWHDARICFLLWIHPYHRGLGETREDRESSQSPRHTDDFKKRPDNFWRARHFCSFHHGGLLAKMRPVGLLSGNSA